MDLSKANRLLLYVRYSLQHVGELFHFEIFTAVVDFSTTVVRFSTVIDISDPDDYHEAFPVVALSDDELKAIRESMKVANLSTWSEKSEFENDAYLQSKWWVSVDGYQGNLLLRGSGDGAPFNVLLHPLKAIYDRQMAQLDKLSITDKDLRYALRQIGKPDKRVPFKADKVARILLFAPTAVDDMEIACLDVATGTGYYSSTGNVMSDIKQAETQTPVITAETNSLIRQLVHSLKDASEVEINRAYIAHKSKAFWMLAFLYDDGTLSFVAANRKDIDASTNIIMYVNNAAALLRQAIALPA